MKCPIDDRNCYTHNPMKKGSIPFEPYKIRCRHGTFWSDGWCQGYPKGKPKKKTVKETSNDSLRYSPRTPKPPNQVGKSGGAVGGEKMSVVLNKDFKELAEKAEQLWGAEAQIDMMIEECSELITVLIKRKRKVNGSTIQDVVNELVDVELMLAQMKNIYGLNQDMWSQFRHSKIERLKKRLE